MYTTGNTSHPQKEGKPCQVTSQVELEYAMEHAEGWIEKSHTV